MDEKAYKNSKHIRGQHKQKDKRQHERVNYICIIYVYIERWTYILDNLDNLIEIVQLLITLLK